MSNPSATTLLAVVEIIMAIVLAIGYSILLKMYVARNTAPKLSCALDEQDEPSLKIDEFGRIIAATPPVSAMFGYSTLELVGRNITVLMPPPHDALHSSYMATYMRTGVQKAIGKTREEVVKKKDGSTFPIMLTVSEIWSADGTNRNFVGVFRDISARKWGELMSQKNEKAIPVSAK